jgi:hypothetical protein
MGHAQSSVMEVTSALVTQRHEIICIVVIDMKKNEPVSLQNVVG